MFMKNHFVIESEQILMPAYFVTCHLVTFLIDDAISKF